MGAELSIDTEALLAQAGWMRGLAFSLLGDQAAADDIVQDATLAALVHAPADNAGLEPWLSRVVRNFAFRRRRGETRRAERESRASGPAHEPSPAETVERLDLQRALIESVLAIEEPLRTTIVLRYFEGKSSAQIARLQRVPAGTVRWRLKRGLDELRERLDARSGSREDWVALIAPFAAHPTAASTGASTVATGSKFLIGVLAMKSAQLAATAAALMILGGIAWWSFSVSREPVDLAAAAAEARPSIDPVTEAPDPATVGASRVADANSSRAIVAAESKVTPEPAPPAPQADERVATVDGRFIDEHGAPWSGVRLAPRKVRWLPKWNPGEAVQSDAEGRVAMRIVLPATRLNRGSMGEVNLEFVASRTGCGTVRCATTLRAGETAHLGDVVLGPGIRILGRAVDESGKGVAQAEIGIVPAKLSEDEGRMRRHGSDSFSDVPGAKTGTDGAFEIVGVPAGALRVWAHADGMRYTWSAPIEVPSDRDVLGLEMLLVPLLVADRIEGLVVGPNSEPIANAQLWFNERSRGSGLGTSLQCNETGRFALLVEHEDSIYSFTARDPEESFTPTTVEGVVPGTLDVLIKMHEKRFLALRVRDTDGGPVEGARFEISARGMGSEVQGAITAPGDYSVALPDGEFHLEVSASGFRGTTRKLDTATLPATLEIVLQRAPLVRGRVLADGKPVAGARVSLLRDDADASSTVSGYRSRYIPYHNSAGTVSDAEGRFRVDCDEDHGFWLRATAEGWAPGEIGPLDAARLGADNEFDIELTRGGAIEGHVLLPDGRDGAGTIVALNHGDGSPRTLRAGPKGLFHVDGLTPGKWQVLQAESEIDPARTSYASVSSGVPIEWSCEVIAGQTTRRDLDLSKP